MSATSGRRAASYEWPSPRLGGGMLLSLLTWVGADMLQARQTQPSAEWALLDVIGHGAVAAYVAMWVWPIWGWPAVAAAACAAVLIDVDHVIAAGSLLPDRLMGLGARPWPHSMLGVLLGTAAAWRLSKASMAYAVGVGLATHVLGDATAWPGVPLLLPLDPNPHVVLPGWTLPLLMAGLSAAGAALCTRTLRRGVRRSA